PKPTGERGASRGRGIAVSRARRYKMNRATLRRSLCLIALSLTVQAWPQKPSPQKPSPQKTSPQKSSQAATVQSTGPVFPNPGKTGMSREDQHALGLQVAGQVYQQMPVLPDSSPETKYIQQLGHKLVSTIPPEYSWPFEFHVVAQKEIN